MPIYNRTVAAQYATKWALARNPKYLDFSHGGPLAGGGDCTNFVSQALNAAGWPMRHETAFGVHPCDWFCDTENGMYSRAWISARNFELFLDASGRAARVYPNALTYGDIVQKCQSGASHATHTMLITGKAKGQLLLSYHSFDFRNIDWKTMMSRGNASDDYIFWKLLDQFEDKKYRYGGLFS